MNFDMKKCMAMYKMVTLSFLLFLYDQANAMNSNEEESPHTRTFHNFSVKPNAEQALVSAQKGLIDATESLEEAAKILAETPPRQPTAYKIGLDIRFDSSDATPPKNLNVTEECIALIIQEREQKQ